MAPATPSPQSAPTLRDLAGPGLRTFFRIMDAWRVEEPARMRILGVPRSTYFRWRNNPGAARLSRDTVERLSYVLGIYKALNILLPSPPAADGWVQRPNRHPLFAGRPPLERLSGGQVADLFVIRQHLDAQRGWN